MSNEHRWESQGRRLCAPGQDMLNNKPVWAELQKLMWRNGVNYTYKNAVKVRDFWVANLKK